MRNGTWRRIWLMMMAALVWLGASLPFATVHAQAAEASIAAKQATDTITVSGQTSSDDASAVPLLITDAMGQIIYVQQVAGGGKAFALEFAAPDWTAFGTAHATLFSASSVSASFAIAKPQPPEKKKLEIGISITGADKEVIVRQQTVHLKDGSSAYDLLRYICNENDIPFEVVDADGDGRDVYIKSINDLAEFDNGAGSGWIYLVNGEQPSMPLDRYKLDNKDKVSFVYTMDFGNSEGGNTSAGELTSIYRTSASAELDKALSQIGFATKPEDLADIIDSLLITLAEYPVEKQKSYIPDVALVLQAAFEKAGMVKDEDLQTKPTGDTLAQELANSTAKALLADQAELRETLTERLANWTLYKGLLAPLKPTLVFPMNQKAAYDTWQLTISADAWQTVRQEKAKISVIKPDWRTDIVPSAEAEATDRPLLFTVKRYDDKAQTQQLSELSSEIVPLTDMYRLRLNPSAAATFVSNWEATTAVDSESLPVLFARAQESDTWTIRPVIVKSDAQHVTAALNHGGDLFFAAVPLPTFEDVQKLPAGYQWAKEAIGQLAAIGVIQGRGENRFDWNANLKRAEALALVNRVMPAGRTVALPDNATALEQPISRAELAYLLAQAAASTREAADKSPTVSPFRDQAAVPAWAQSSVTTVAGRGWLKGRTDGRFDPVAPLTRAEAAAALYRMLQEQSGQAKK